MSPGNNRLGKQIEAVQLFDKVHNKDRKKLNPAERNELDYNETMGAAKEKAFDFWEVEYECPDPGPYPEWAFGKEDMDQYRLTPDVIWSDIVAEKKREYEMTHPTKWYEPPQKSNEVKGWLDWVMKFNEKTNDEKNADTNWKWDGNHKLYLPKNNAWYRINRYLVREAEYSGLLHWSKSRISPDMYYETKRNVET